MSYFFYEYASPLGPVLLASDGLSLTALCFAGQKHIDRHVPADGVQASLPVFDVVCRWLDVYFAGKIPPFGVPLRLCGTAFQQDVWRVLMSIPYGETVTYGDVARRLARDKGLSFVSAQAVGGAVGRNPLSVIIPCHRVIGADGRLTGYAGGLDKKEWLLRLERNSLGK